MFYVFSSSSSSSGQQQHTAAAHSKQAHSGFSVQSTRIIAEARMLYTGSKQKQKELKRTEKNGSNGSE